MPEVYRVLFEVFGMDPEAEDCQPKLRRQLEDVDYVSVEFESRKLSWQDVAAYKVITNYFLFLIFLLLRAVLLSNKIFLTHSSHIIVPFLLLISSEESLPEVKIIIPVRSEIAYFGKRSMSVFIFHNHSKDVVQSGIIFDI